MTQNNNEYPVIPKDRGADLHNLEYADSADLVLFMAGNQFMLMPELVNAFQMAHPEVETIVYETLPPGLELNQILAGGAKFRGKTYQIQPDIYSSVSKKAMQTLAAKNFVNPNAYFVYLHNKLALMVKKGNPKDIQSVLDLGREDIIVSQPNAEYEHIADHIAVMYDQAGGQELLETILSRKKAAGTTLMTTVHHRQTPRRLIGGNADVGPVWHTEIVEAKRTGLAVEGVEIDRALDQREAINYYIAPLKNCRHPENAKKILEFIKTERARKIFTDYGFVVPSE